VTAALPSEAPVATAAATIAAPRVVEVFHPRPEPVIESRPEPVTAPVVASRPPPPPAQSVDVDAALRESGLVMIQTKADRVAPQATEEEPLAPRQRRERRPPPADLNTPLMQVETRKQDADAPPQ
jgi:ribonuclease E